MPFLLRSAQSKDWSACDLVCVSQVEEDRNGSEPLGEEGVKSNDMYPNLREFPPNRCAATWECRGPLCPTDAALALVHEAHEEPRPLSLGV